MITALVITGYVLLGIGTARVMLARTIANDVAEFKRISPVTFKEGGIDAAIQWSWNEYGPLNFMIAVLSCVFWPFVAAYLVVLRPVGTVVAPLLVKWWRAPRDRILRKEGLL